MPDAILQIGNNLIPIEMSGGIGPKGDPGSGENVVDTLDLLAAIDTATGPEIVYVREVDASYAFEALSAATADGWAVVAPDVGSGRWLLESGRLTVAALGSAANDVPRLAAAAQSVSTAGKALRLRPETYTLDTVWELPLDGVLIETTPQTELNVTLTPDGSPATAGLYAAPGSTAATTTVAAANGVSEYTVSSAASVAVGKLVRIQDDVSGSGFHGSTYEVKAVSGAGPYILTLDRPVLTQFGVGDAIDVFNKIPTNIRVTGGALVTGSGTRLLEFICTRHCHVDLVFRPDNVGDAVASFDLFGFDNHLLADVEENGSGAVDGIFLESQESSSVCARVGGFANGVGVSFFDCEQCVDRSEVWGCEIGVAARGDGNVTGCNDCRIEGIYNSNTLQGIGIANGSRGTKINAIAKFNPTNVAIGDGAGGNVSDTVLEGDFAAATSIGISIAASALGTALGIVDTSDCPTGISAQGNYYFSHHSHRGALGAAGSAILNDGAVVRGCSIDYNITTGSVNVVKTVSDGVTVIMAGDIVAGADSNLFFADNTARIEVGAVTGVASGSSVGAYANNASSTILLSPESDFSGCGSPTGGPGVSARLRAHSADPQVPTVLSDEFMGNSVESGEVGSLGWNLTTGTASATSGESGHPGVVALSCTTTTGAIAALHLGATNTSIIIAVADVSEFAWVTKEQAATVTDCDHRFGLFNNMSSATGDGIYLERLAADTNWFLVARASGAETRVDTGFAGKTTAWFKAEFRRVSATEWRVSINNGGGIPVTSNVPAGSVLVQPGLMLIPTAVTSRAMRIDFFSLVTNALSR